MQITISGRHLHVSDHLKEYVNEKFARLERHYDLLQHVDIVIFDESGKKHVEATAKGKVGGRFLGKAEHEHVKAAVDLVVDKLERQMTKQKQKVKGHRNISLPRPRSREEPVQGDEPTYEEIVEGL